MVYDNINPNYEVYLVSSKIDGKIRIKNMRAFLHYDDAIDYGIWLKFELKKRGFSANNLVCYKFDAFSSPKFIYNFRKVLENYERQF